MLATANWFRAAAVVALAATACGSIQHAQSPSGTPSGSSSPTASAASPTAYPTTYPSPTTASSAREQCPSVQPAPQFAPSAPSSRNLALVQLRGSDQTVVRDITDINHATTVATLDPGYLARFVSAADLSYPNTQGLVRRPFVGSPVLVAACSGFFDWSPDGTIVTYLTAGQELDLRQVKSGLNVKLDSMPNLPAVGCENPSCGDQVDQRLLYSPDGNYISFVQNWGGPVFRLWTSDGHLVKGFDSGGSLGDSTSPTMSVWSGKSLYFRDDKGVEMWRDARQSLLLPGVAWIQPRASSAGGQIVYGVRDGSGMAHVDLLDTTSGMVREVAKSRSQPAFLTSRYIWYRGERPCVTGDPFPCGAALTIPTGKTYIYDLQTGTEAESIITNIWDVWPHPA